ncbi:MAG: hypothetical protein CMP39_03995 [Rickettsiales bacterium]|nr:hypothetical protein [Rickettsiales bacterium]
MINPLSSSSSSSSSVNASRKNSSLKQELTLNAKEVKPLLADLTQKSEDIVQAKDKSIVSRNVIAAARDTGTVQGGTASISDGAGAIATVKDATSAVAAANIGVSVISAATVLAKGGDIYQRWQETGTFFSIDNTRDAFELGSAAAVTTTAVGSTIDAFTACGQAAQVASAAPIVGSVAAGISLVNNLYTANNQRLDINKMSSANKKLDTELSKVGELANTKVQLAKTEGELANTEGELKEEQKKLFDLSSTEYTTEELKTQQNKVTDLKNKVTDLKNNVTDLKNNVTDLKNKVTDLKNIEAKSSDLKKTKKAIDIGKKQAIQKRTRTFWKIAASAVMLGLAIAVASNPVGAAVLALGITAIAVTTLTMGKGMYDYTVTKQDKNVFIEEVKNEINNNNKELDDVDQKQLNEVEKKQFEAVINHRDFYKLIDDMPLLFSDNIESLLPGGTEDITMEILCQRLVAKHFGTEEALGNLGLLSDGVPNEKINNHRSNFFRGNDLFGSKNGLNKDQCERLGTYLMAGINKAANNTYDVSTTRYLLG